MFLITFLLLWQNTKATKERNHVGLMILEGEPMTNMARSMAVGVMICGVRWDHGRGQTCHQTELTWEGSLLEREGRERERERDRETVTRLLREMAEGEWEGMELLSQRDLCTCVEVM